jgi:cytochrome c oxidase cbb3-type subunit 2
MPAYRFLSDTALRADRLPKDLATLKKLGVPYSDAMIENAENDAYAQALPDSDGAAGVKARYGEATDIRVFDGNPETVTEMDALVAYLQILGRLTDAAHTQEGATEGTAEK